MSKRKEGETHLFFIFFKHNERLGYQQVFEYAQTLVRRCFQEGGNGIGREVHHRWKTLKKKKKKSDSII